MIPRPSPDHLMGLGLAAMAAGVVLLGVLGLREEYPSIRPVGPGDPMPAMVGPMLDGGQAALGEGNTGGDVVLVDFWASWCPPCVESMPLMQRLHARYADAGLRLLAVNADRGSSQGEQAEIARRFLEDHDIDVPVLLDDGALQRAFRVQSLPTLFLVGRDGLVRDVWVGSASERALVREIESALADE